MISRRRLTPARLVSLGTLALLLTLLLLSSHYQPLDFRVLNPAHFLTRFLQASQPLTIATSERFLHQKKKTTGNTYRKCTLYTLRGALRGPEEKAETGEAAECRRVPPVPGSCQVADRLFNSSSPASCGGQASVEFCSLMSTKQGHYVQCSGEQCASSLLAAVQDPHTGLLRWKKFQTTQKLEDWINSLLQPSADGQKKHFGFCFIGCGDTMIITEGELFSLQDNSVLDSSAALQLLVLPPYMPAGQSTHSGSSSDINFNLIFIDSVSRQHFFRSLPNTVKLFEELRKDNASGVTVLDFELVQALRSRTFESIQTLFSGEVDPFVKPFGVLELPPEPLKTEALLKRLKERGYSTLWLEDLCYLWEWGLSKDLLVHNKTLTAEQTWQQLQIALNQAGIDSLELTYAMCQVLSLNGVPDHFHGPDAVCMNGVHQHDYLLHYLAVYQHTMVRRGTPFFSFLETNVGHEDTGKRIQAFDPSLQHYLKSVLELNNTLTVVFSDHGNSYGAFVEQTMEGRMELFHPHLFMLVPDSVAAFLGPAAMKALHTNQHRLVSLLDVHYMLRSLVHGYGRRAPTLHSQFEVSGKGVLSVIPTNRTCHQIPRIMPNLCICQNFDMPVDSDDYHALFAYMALGKINNQIQLQFFQQAEQARGKHVQGFGRCQQLALWNFNNVKKSFSGTTISLKMDLLVPLTNSKTSEGVSWKPGQLEVFFVSMVLELGGGNSFRPSIILETLDRITPYSKFSVCADPTVKLQLCVCNSSINTTRQSEQDIGKTRGAILSEHLKSEVFVADGTEECLQLIVKKNDHGGVFSVANVCMGRVFHVVFSLQTSGMIVSDLMPRQESVFPGQELLLCMAVKNAPRADWDWSFTLHQRQQTL